MTTSTKYVQQFRARKRQGRLLLPRIGIDHSIADDLVETNLLAEWDTEDPAKVAEAIVKLLKQLRNVIP
jgi:hypothetical protein